MADQQQTFDISKLSDQWLTNFYCRELLKVKAAAHFRGKISLGQPNHELVKLFRHELKRRKLIVPSLSFRVSVQDGA